jgi:hypothetical protein
VTTGAPPSAGTARAKWILVVFGPLLFMAIASAVVMLYLPHPIP